LINVFPNPATNTLNISIDGAENLSGKGAIYDTMGRLVKKFELKGQTQVNISDLKSGLYILKYITENNETGACRFAVQ
jgi:hypothetical protein